MNEEKQPRIASAYVAIVPESWKAEGLSEDALKWKAAARSWELRYKELKKQLDLNLYELENKIKELEAGQK